MEEEKNKQYLFELDKFLDLTENIEDNELKRIIVNQVLKCIKLLTENNKMKENN